MTTLWTCIARCRTCKRELNRAENVPDESKFLVSLGAPLMAVCPDRSHNTFSDLNLRVELDWVEEPALAFPGGTL